VLTFSLRFFAGWSYESYACEHPSSDLQPATNLVKV